MKKLIYACFVVLIFALSACSKPEPAEKFETTSPDQIPTLSDTLWEAQAPKQQKLTRKQKRILENHEKDQAERKRGAADDDAAFFKEQKEMIERHRRSIKEQAEARAKK